MASAKTNRSEPSAKTAGREPASKPRRQRNAGAKDIETIEIDPFRAFVFPNRVREQRQRHGYPKLLALAAALPEIPYIRLSKIERGEVFARPDELRRIGWALGIQPVELLVDVADPSFDIAAWSGPFRDSEAAQTDEERFAVMLGAALRLRRTSDAKLSIAALERDYGVPPVILSRIENALKPLERWNEPTRAALCRIFDVDNEEALRELVVHRQKSGDLGPFLAAIVNPALRVSRTGQRVAELRASLASDDEGAGSPGTSVPNEIKHADVSPQDAALDYQPRRMLPVYGSPLPGGLIALSSTGSVVEAPAAAGPSAFGLRVCRPTLGGGLPGHATVIVDPDRFPAAGGLGAILEGPGYRLVTVTLDREGRMKGYSVNPDIEVALDALDPKTVCAVVAGLFV